ncbi:hypothetical protein BU26DRAFT_433875, partial [Trematosphaeria pertusa]
ELKNSLLNLILAVQGLSTSRSLPSKGNNVSLYSNLLDLNLVVYSSNFDIKYIIPLLRVVLNNKPNKVI